VTTQELQRTISTGAAASMSYAESMDPKIFDTMSTQRSGDTSILGRRGVRTATGQRLSAAPGEEARNAGNRAM